MADVFLSYAREDREVAGRLAAAIEQRHLSVWWDRTLIVGDNFGTVIERELASAKSVVVLWSHHSVQSRWVRDEAENAANRGMLIPILLDESAGQGIPLGTRSIQHLDLRETRDEHIQGVADLIVAAATRRVGRSGPEVIPGTSASTPQSEDKARSRWRPAAALTVGAAVVIAVVATAARVGTRGTSSTPTQQATPVEAAKTTSDSGRSVSVGQGNQETLAPPRPTTPTGARSLVRPDSTVQVASNGVRPDPTIQIAVASQLYKRDDVAGAVAILRRIGQDQRFDKRHRLLAFDAAAQILVEAGKLDSGRAVIQQMLDFEPPLILITPDHGSTAIGREYDRVRGTRLGTLERGLQIDSGMVLTILPFQRLAGGIEYPGIEKGLQDLLITDLSVVGGIRIVDREFLQAIINEQTAQARKTANSIGDAYGRLLEGDQSLRALLPTGKRAFYVPAELENGIDSINLVYSRAARAAVRDPNPTAVRVGKLLSATHVLTGSFIIDSNKVVISAWLVSLNSASVNAVAVVRTPPDHLLDGVAQLGRDLVAQLQRKR